MTDTMQPPAPARKPWVFVLQSGIITTAVSLAGVYWLNANTDKFSIMGWYAYYVIPIGAVFVGVVAGSGYGLASWFTGARIGRGLLLVVLLLQAGAYVAAEYVEYRNVRKQFEEKGLVLADTGKPPTFAEYYDIKARSFAWKSKRGDTQGEALGAWGYVFVLLGAAGFIAAGLIAPAVLMATPYCDSCQRYMSTRTIAVLPASVPIRKIDKSDAAGMQAFEEEQVQAGVSAEQAVQRLRDAAQAGNVEAFTQELAAAGDAKINNKLPRRVAVALIWCKGCENGRIIPSIVTGQGDRTEQTKLEATPVAPSFVQAVR